VAHDFKKCDCTSCKLEARWWAQREEASIDLSFRNLLKSQQVLLRFAECFKLTPNALIEKLEKKNGERIKRSQDALRSKIGEADAPVDTK
jgi:hypothetical protein